jgi:hypothetical protein
VAIEYGFALRKLGDSAVIGVLNENFGSPEDLPFDIIHKRWPVKYRLVEEATKAEVDLQRARLKGQFIAALKGFIDNPQPAETVFEETSPNAVNNAYFFHGAQSLGYSRQVEQNGDDVYMLFEDAIYMRLIPTKPLARPVSEEKMISAAAKYGAMGAATPFVPIVNDFGAMCFSPAGNSKNVTALTQYFANGEVWAINSDILRQGVRGATDKWYLLVSAEDAFLNTLENGLHYLTEVAGAELPVKVTAGVLGMHRRHLVIVGEVIGRRGRMMTNEVHHTMLLQDGSQEAQDKYLLQLFEKIFDQSGNRRPRGLNGFPKPGT